MQCRMLLRTWIQRGGCTAYRQQRILPAFNNTCWTTTQRRRMVSTTTAETTTRRIHDDSNIVQQRQQQTQKWLKNPHWTDQEMATGRFLLDEWFALFQSASLSKQQHYPATGVVDPSVAAALATKILRRWLYEETNNSTNNLVNNNNNNNLDLMSDALKRVLNQWKLILQSQTIKNDQQLHQQKQHARTVALQLVQDFHNASLLPDDQHRLAPLKPDSTAYSMLLEIMALTPHIPNTVPLAQTLMTQQQQQQQLDNTTTTDLVLWNSYLHLLAECSPYDATAAQIAEDVVTQHMPQHSITPSLRSWAAVLRAWTRRIHNNTKTTGSNQPQQSSFEAAKRAQAVLEHLVATLQPSPPPHHHHHHSPNNDDSNDNLVVLYNIVLDAWGRLGQGEQAERLLRQMMRMENHSTTTTADLDDNETTTLVNTTTTTTDIRPDHQSFLAVVNAWKNQSNNNNSRRDPDSNNNQSSPSQRAKQVVQSMQPMGLTPTTEIYTALMETWGQQPNMGLQVQQLLDEMEQADIGSSSPSILTYAAAIRAWGRTQPDGLQHAMELVRRLEQDLGQDETAADLLPDTYIYTALMQAWAESDRRDAPKQTLALLRRMEALSSRGRKTTPSTVSYNVVLHVLSKHGEAEMARALLDAMNERTRTFPGAAQPDVVSYATVMHAFSRKEFAERAGEEGRMLIGEMEDLVDSGNASLEPTPDIYAAAIYAHAHMAGEANAEAAESILWHFQERSQSGQTRHCPTTKTANAVLRVWAQSREAMAPERAEALLRWMRKQVDSGDGGMEPNLETFNSLMQTWSCSRRRQAVARIRELHDEVEANPDTMRLDTDYFNHLLRAYRHASMKDKLTESVQVFEDMLRKSTAGARCKPNLYTFQLLLDMFKHPQNIHSCSSLSVVQDSFQVIVNNFCKSDVKATKSAILGFFKAYANLRMDSKQLLKELLLKYASTNGKNMELQNGLEKILSKEEATNLIHDVMNDQHNAFSSREDVFAIRKC